LAISQNKTGDLTAKDAEGAKEIWDVIQILSFAVKTAVIQNDGLERGEFAPRSLFGRE
jgi:hypothetical protein